MTWIETECPRPASPALTDLADRADQAAARLRARTPEPTPEPTVVPGVVRFEVTVRLPTVVVTAVARASTVVRWLLQGGRP